MTQLASVFPEKISRGFVGGPNWRTDKTVTAAGFQYRNRGWSQPLQKWTAGHDARTEADFAAVRAHFMNSSGNSFPFKDWLDYQCPDSNGTGVFITLTSTTFQLAKRYTSGASTFDRKIILPKSTISVVGGSGVSVNYSTGVVTVSSGTPTAWSGEFYCLCSYTDDAMDAVLIDGPIGDRVVGWSGIQIEEVRV